jgi:hypothetical protein
VGGASSCARAGLATEAAIIEARQMPSFRRLENGRITKFSRWIA